MKSFSLSVYEVTINRYLRKEELQNLSDYDNGKNFLKEFDSMFLSWKKDLARSVVKDAEAKKASRIKKDSQGEWLYFYHETYVDGIIESGEYGTQEDIVNIETGESKYTKTAEDVALVPFYFMLYIEPNSTKGYLILERIGNNGILSIIDKAIRDFRKPYIQDKSLTLNIRPCLVPKILEFNLSSVGGAKKVVLKGVNSNQFKNMQIEDSFADCRTEVSFNAPRNKFISKVTKILDNLKNKKEEEPFKVNNIECADVAFELDINGSHRTVTIAKLSNLGMNIDVTSEIVTDATGYPTYESLASQAHTILSYLLVNNKNGND